MEGVLCSFPTIAAARPAAASCIWRWTRSRRAWSSRGRIFSPAQLEELSRSIAEYGVLSPLTVRPRQGGYELVAGERRLRAARMAGLHEVPCIIMELDLEEASFIALVENLQRNDLTFSRRHAASRSSSGSSA